MTEYTLRETDLRTSERYIINQGSKAEMEAKLNSLLGKNTNKVYDINEIK